MIQTLQQAFDMLLRVNWEASRLLCLHGYPRIDCHLVLMQVKSNQAASRVLEKLLVASCSFMMRRFPPSSDDRPGLLMVGTAPKHPSSQVHALPVHAAEVGLGSNQDWQQSKSVTTKSVSD